MDRVGLSALLRAGLLGVLTWLSFASALRGADAPAEPPIATSLEVQKALAQGRDLLLQGRYRDAVEALESQISRINGSRQYLTVLRDAYRAYIRELQLARKDTEAGEYLKRLRIIDPGAIIDSTARATAPAPARPTVARGKIDDDPFRPDNRTATRAPAVLERAEAEFAAKHYAEAGRLFEQAYQASSPSDASCCERWAYCKLYQIVDLLNGRDKEAVPAEMEREVRSAIALAPRLEPFGKDLLRKIEERRGTPSAPGTASVAPAAVSVRHQERGRDGWYVSESANFRIVHNQQRDYVEQVARVAEATKVAMEQRWGGEVGPDWGPRCEVFLHATAQDYSRATGVPPGSPGHSTIRTEGGRVVGRRVDLHVDDPNLLTAVLPHEATHVIVAGLFGEHQIPRWADEGMAVMSEPRDKIDRHVRQLPQLGRDQQLIALRQLMQMNDYPDPRHITAFYAQSVSVVEFLSREKGTQTFTQFVREGLRSGYEPALRKFYGIQDGNDLEQRWRRQAFGEAAAMTAGYARQRP